MGDDAELYWEMEHNPYFWDEVESCSRNNSFTENKSKKKKKTIQTKSNSTRKKVNAALFIDGENISSKKAEQIQKIANKQGEYDFFDHVIHYTLTLKSGFVRLSRTTVFIGNILLETLMKNKEKTILN